MSFSAEVHGLPWSHRSDSQGIHAADAKVKAIKQAPVPTNLKELIISHGLVNY